MSKGRFTFRNTSPQAGAPAAASTGGRLFGTVFFLIWCAIPSFMLVMMGRQVARDAAPWSWKPADCTVVESGVREEGSDGDWAFTVRYTYAAGPLSAVEAPRREGHVYARGYRGSAQYADAQRLAIRYAPGSRATCYVNPDDPTEAVLKRQFPWLVLMTPLPLAFVAIGLGALWYLWSDRKPAAAAATTPISSGPSATKVTAKGSWAAAVFCGLFFLIGSGVMWAMGGSVMNVFAARSWTKTPATVVSSDVRRHSGDSTTYSVNILYSYSVDGREYRSNRYKFMGGSSSGIDGKRRIVNRYPPGTKFTAYVNPADPVDAVIERGFTADMLLLLIPFAFMAAGGIGAAFAVRHARRLSLATAPAVNSRLAAPLAGRFVPTGGSAPQARRLTIAARSGVSLKPRQSPMLKFVGLTCVALFWNGIVSVFLYQVVKDWRRGRFEVCLSIFLLPFVAVGVGLIVGAFHSLMALFNPRCEVALDRDPIVPGETVEFRWRFTGRYDRIHRLVLRVEGREEATYRQGTTTHTDKNVFFVRELADTSRAVDIQKGKARWDVPADTMHSFSAPNNKIVWVLCVHGHIQGWPDVKDEYVLTVAPGRAHTLMPPPDGEEESAPRLAAPLAARFPEDKRVDPWT